MNKVYQTRSKSQDNSIEYSVLTDLLTDIALFTRKWTTPKLAKIKKTSKQGLEYHVKKKEASK